jgi:hypothetical protein
VDHQGADLDDVPADDPVDDPAGDPVDDSVDDPAGDPVDDSVGDPADYAPADYAPAVVPAVCPVVSSEAYRVDELVAAAVCPVVSAEAYRADVLVVAADALAVSLAAAPVVFPVASLAVSPADVDHHLLTGRLLVLPVWLLPA